MAKARSYKSVIKDLAFNIKKLRTDHSFTQERMAEFGFNYRFYQKLESGSYSPNLHTIYRLAEFFKVDVADLFKPQK